MSEHEKQKGIELADGVGYAIEAVVSRAATAGDVIWTGQAVMQVQAQCPDIEMSAAELAEAIVRAAAAKGLAISIQKLD